MSKPQFVFFGSSSLSMLVLDELARAGFIPTAIVTSPDEPKGRNLVLTPPPTKVWALAHDVAVLQPEKLRGNTETLKELSKLAYDFFVVASYGKIIPQEILDIPRLGTLNVHPSLLPKFRGPDPLRAQILADEKEVGVTIMQIDAEVDHGPIVVQEKVAITPWPPRASELENTLGKSGGMLLAKILPDFVQGKITPKEQNHSKATFTKKVEKKDGELDLSGDPYQNFLKIRAYDGWPGTYFFVERNGKQLRVLVKDAEYADGTLTLTRVLPEGGKEMSYEDFLRGNR